MKWFMIWKIFKNIMMVHMNEYSSIYHTIYCLGTKLYIYIPCVPYTIYICNSDCNILSLYIYTEYICTVCQKMKTFIPFIVKFK